jgi:hypothetical protein
MAPILKDLCPSSPDALKALEARRVTLAEFFGQDQCLLERGSHWVSYRVTNVPRKVGQVTGNCEQTLVLVNSQAVAQAVAQHVYQAR